MSDKPMSDKRCPVCLSDSRKYGNMRPCADAWHTEREYLGSPAQHGEEMYVAIRDRCAKVEAENERQDSGQPDK